MTINKENTLRLEDFLELSIQSKLSLEEQKNFLRSYEIKTPEELRDVVLFFRKHCSESVDIRDAIDVCGTGGSGQRKINVSTLSALILAALGIKVAKHGNRAVTGQCGSFDLLEALGLNFSQPNKNLEVVYQKENCVFLYAPLFYPIMRFFSQARKEAGKPTFFNLLGPLLNPASVKRQIIGTPFKDKMLLLAETCRLLGSEHVYIVSSKAGLDEVTLSGETNVVELRNGQIQNYTLSPKDFGIAEMKDETEHGGTISENNKIAEAIIRGEGDPRDMDFVLLNTALALKLAGKERSLKSAYKTARSALTEGLVQKKLESIKRSLNTPSVLLEIAENKRKEVEDRKGKQTLSELKKELEPSSRNTVFLKEAKKQSKYMKLIAEIKRASPSEGTIALLDPLVLAKKYEEAGVLAISVLCDKKYFQGDLTFLKMIAQETKSAPLLCKDFIIDEYQIYEARKAGADLVLLIAALLSRDKMENFLQICKKLNMTALCEVHNEEELKEVLKTSAQVIGINNRNLNTFKIDLSTTEKLLPLIPRNKIVISESGFQEGKDVAQFVSRIDGILVGTALMKSMDLERKILELKGKKSKVKICGVQTLQEALLCEKAEVDMIGLNFVNDSKRRIRMPVASMICGKIHKAKKVGVFRNQSLDAVNKISADLNLDYIQLCGEEDSSYIRRCIRPVMKTIKITGQKDLETAIKLKPYVRYLLFDSSEPGSGNSFDHDVLKTFNGNYFLAGGVRRENVSEILTNIKPLGVDVATGVETDGKRDPKKLKNLLEIL